MVAEIYQHLSGLAQDSRSQGPFIAACIETGGMRCLIHALSQPAEGQSHCILF